MHACLSVRGTNIMASDGNAKGKPKFEGFSLSFPAKDETEADQLFAALSDGGQVQMPLMKTFFSPRFGMVADKFGVSWMVIVNQPAAGEKSKDFVITRVLDAPRELVWQAFTDPKRMKEWWGPKGAKVVHSKMDLKPGRNLPLRHADAGRRCHVGQVHLPRDRAARAPGVHQLASPTRTAASRAIRWRRAGPC